MAQTKHQIQSLLASISAPPRHRWGQNFMIDGNLVRLIAEAGEVSPGDLVIEVGPGTGSLTDELLDRSRPQAGARVLAVEIDPKLAELLRHRLGGEGAFALIEGDALAGKHQLNHELATAIAQARQAGSAVKLVSNLPYNIASPLVIELLLAGVDLLAFTVQKEVAQRLKAGSGTEAYGPLSVMAQLLAEVQVLRTIPPQAFWPSPKVESSLLLLRRADRLGEKAGPFHGFLQRLFSARRKTLRNALERAAGQADVDSAAQRLKLDLRQRPEQLGPQELVELFVATQRA